MFPSRIDHLGDLSTKQYARLVDEWVTIIGLDKREFGTHSRRRTKASLIYKEKGNLRAVKILLGWSALLGYVAAAESLFHICYQCLAH